MDLLWEIGQEGRIEQARSNAYQAAARVKDVAEYASLLENRLDKLALICRGMWSFLKEATRLTEEELLARVKEIDLADGQLDGKVRLAAIPCPNCSRMMTPKHGRCLWCGEPTPKPSAFDQL